MPCSGPHACDAGCRKEIPRARHRGGCPAADKPSLEALPEEYHRDVAFPYLGAYLKQGFGVEILGGGRIAHDPERRRAKPAELSNFHSLSGDLCVSTAFPMASLGGLVLVMRSPQRCVAVPSPITRLEEVLGTALEQVTWSDEGY